MLSLLHIENIAVIDRADISFDQGFNVLTGETGAGKSIVIDAISAILGERAYRDMIRTGTNKASVRAVFTDVPEIPWFSENGVDYDPETGIQTIMEGVTHEISSGKPGEDPFAQGIANEKMMYVVEEIQIITEKAEREFPYMDTEPEIVEWRKEEISIIGMGGTEEWMKQKSYRLLSTDGKLCNLYQGVVLMAMGFIDGQFHILLRESGTDSSQDLGYGVRLFDKEGNSIIWENGISYTDETGAKCSEWLFYVTEEEIKSYTLVFNFSRSETIKGPWRVTFPVTAADPEN